MLLTGTIFLILSVLAQIIFSFLKIKNEKQFTKPLPIQELISIASFFLGLTALTSMPIFSGLMITTLLLVTWVINNAKFNALNEALVFSDIALFSQVFKYPRLYLPFIHKSIFFIAIPFAIFILSALYYYGVLKLIGQNVKSSIYLILPAIALYLYLHHSLKKENITVDTPESLLQRHGMLGSLLLGYIKTFKKPLSETESTLLLTTEIITTPNIIVIQSESFFDARRLSKHIDCRVLENYDYIKKNSIQYGVLNVPAWGANTMRTEFSFLSGIPNSALGLQRFYPYHFIKHTHVSLPNILKQAGYYCVCIHPYESGFFQRKRVFPLLGFDEFIDIKQFKNAQKQGAYISDDAVLKQIIATIESKTEKPLFVFAITMENHGPLHLEALNPQEKSFITQKFLTHPHDLIVYLKHLNNADKMLHNLTTYLNASPTPTVVGFYGDHVPSMPSVYQALAYTHPATNYCIWHSKNNIENQSTEADLPIENLAYTLLQQAGIITPMPESPPT